MQEFLLPILSGRIEPRQEPAIWPRTREVETQVVRGSVTSLSCSSWEERGEVRPTSNPYRQWSKLVPRRTQTYYN